MLFVVFGVLSFGVLVLLGMARRLEGMEVGQRALVAEVRSGNEIAERQMRALAGASAFVNCTLEGASGSQSSATAKPPAVSLVVPSSWSGPHPAICEDKAGPAGLKKRVLIRHQPSSVLRRLRVVEGREAGRTYRVFPASCIIGRSVVAELRIEDDSVSRRHAYIHHDVGGFSVVDLGSGNGTYVNGQRVGNRPRKLTPGDEIQVGHIRLKFV